MYHGPSPRAERPLVSEPRPATGLGDRVLARLRRLESWGPVLRLVAAKNDLQFWAWQRRNPGLSYADFYAWQIGRKLDRGGAHKTLGQRVFRNNCDKLPGSAHDADSFARTGRAKFDRIVAAAGLKPDDVVADFGCGSLRIGQHFIRALAPGHYWGLDVTDRFYSDGVAMIGAATMARRRPNLRVIGPQALAEAAAARPSLVVSVAVLKHVPADEWAVYFDRLMSLVAPRGRLVITYTLGARPGRVLGKSWSSRTADVMHEIDIRRPGARFLLPRVAGASAGDPAAEGTEVMLLARWDAGRADRTDGRRNGAYRPRRASGTG